MSVKMKKTSVTRECGKGVAEVEEVACVSLGKAFHGKKAGFCHIS